MGPHGRAQRDPAPSEEPQPEAVARVEGPIPRSTDHGSGSCHFGFMATGKSGTLGGLTVVGVCSPLVSSLTRSEM